MSDKQRINGNQYSWSSIFAKFADQDWFGYTSIKYGDKRERVKAYGAGPSYTPRGRTSGKYSCEASCEMFKASAQDLRHALAAQASDGRSYGNVEFDVVIQYIEADETPVTVELLRCVIVGQDADDQESPDPLKETMTLDPMMILRNGLCLFDATLGV